LAEDGTYWLHKSLAHEADLDVARNKLYRLEKFYQEVARLTLNHDVIRAVDGNEYASVAPSNLGPLLEEIDPKWYANVKD